MGPFDQHLNQANRLDAITQKVGFALWQLQELESVAAQSFVLLTQAKKGMGLAAGNSLIDKAQRKTFGATIHQITKAGLLNSELETRFTNLLSERNWLVHKSRASSRGAVHSDGIAQKLILRVDAIAEESLALIKEIALLAEHHVKRHGVSEQHIRHEAEKLLEHWHTSDAI